LDKAILLLQKTGDGAEDQSPNSANEGDQQSFGQEDPFYLLLAGAKALQNGDVAFFIEDQHR